MLDGNSSSSSNSNVLLLQSTMFNKSTTLTSISSDSVSNFMISNFTAMPFSNRNRETDSDREKRRLSDKFTYPLSMETSNKSESVRIVHSKRGGPKRVRIDNLLKNMTRVNITSDIKTGTNLYRHSYDTENSSHSDDLLISNLSRVSRAPQNARRKNVKSHAVTANTTEMSVTKPIKVSLLGLFELTSRSGLRMEGRSELAAAELAVKHINEQGLLEGYMLELMTNDTQVSGWH